MTEIINVKLVETNLLTRWHCTVCDGHTEKEPILAEGIDTSLPHPHTVRVCERCLRGDQSEINRRLLNTAESLKQYAAYVESLVGRLRVPTYAAWEATRADHEERWVRENTRCRSVAEYEAQVAKCEAEEKEKYQRFADADDLPF